MASHSLRRCLIVGESMAATMKEGRNGNLHGYLHGGKKIEKSLVPDKTPVQGVGRLRDRQRTTSSPFVPADRDVGGPARPCQPVGFWRVRRGSGSGDDGGVCGFCRLR